MQQLWNCIGVGEGREGKRERRDIKGGRERGKEGLVRERERERETKKKKGERYANNLRDLQVCTYLH